MFKPINIQLISYFLKSPVLLNLLFKSETGTANQGNIGVNAIRNQLIPLPPLSEQNRIVEKVNQLMALCDELEAHQQKAVDKRTQLNDSAIYNLLAVQDVDEFADHWQLICDNFDLLYDNADNVDKLRQAILQLAVKGKLVPQDKKDELASELLKRIKAEKERLIKEDKIKKMQPMPPIEPDQVPYELPNGWEWTRWDIVSRQIGDVDHKMPIEEQSGFPYVSPRDFRPNNGIDFKNAKKISESDFQRLSKKIKPEKFDIIFPRYGTIGENRFVITDIEFLASYSCAIVKSLIKFVSPKYIFFYSLSPLVKSEIDRYINKTTQPNVGVKSIKSFIFPLPPVEEQNRIVEKADHLMALCDDLEARLNQSQDDSGKLLDAVLYETMAA